MDGTLPEMFPDLLALVLVIAGALFVSLKLRVPPILGYIAAGVIVTLVGPQGLHIVGGTAAIKVLAEPSVALLFLAVGIEFSFDQVRRLWRAVFIGGMVQVCLTALATTALSWLVVQDLRTAIFFGFVVSMSSTAFVVEFLEERGEIETPSGRLAIGILLFQDLMLLPLSFLVPVLAGSVGGLWGWTYPVLQAVLILGAVFFAGWLLVDPLLKRVSRMKDRVFFLMTLVLVCGATVRITTFAGLSPALGAFLAGLIISRSEYSHEILGRTLPFRDLFSPFFFVTMGMLIDLRQFVDHLPMVIGVTLAIITLKVLIGVIAVLLVRYPLRVALQVGGSIAQLGEFSFVLASIALGASLIVASLHQLILAATALSMVLTPLVLRATCWLGTFANGFSQRSPVEKVDDHRRRDHVILVGCGQTGHIVLAALKAREVPFIVLELNEETLTKLRRDDLPAIWGDCRNVSTLRRLGLKDARLIVLTISDEKALEEAVHIVRQENPEIPIVVRSKHLTHLARLRKRGATVVIPEDVASGVAVAESVVRVLGLPIVGSDDIGQKLTTAIGDLRQRS